METSFLIDANLDTTASIFNTYDVETTAEYVAKHRHTNPALDWDSVGDVAWKKLAAVLNIDIEIAGGKARRAIDKAADIIAGQKKPVPVSTSVPTTKTPAEIQAKVVEIKQEIQDNEAQKEAQRQALANKALENLRKSAEPIPAQVEDVEETPAVETPAPVAAPQPKPAAPKAQPAPAPVARPEVNAPANQLAELFAKLLTPQPAPAAPAMDEERIREIAAETASAMGQQIINTMAATLTTFADQINAAVDAKLTGAAKTTEVKTNDLPAVNVGLTHYAFEDILTAANARVNIMLVGPSGAGKTHVCEQVATGLDLPFYMASVCNQTSKVDFLGFRNITTGEYVATDFRQAYEFGGVYLLDEIDNGNANVLSVLNAALSNGGCSFGDGYVKRHKDFILIAGANTYGTGANRTYVGRNQIDGATLNRFITIEFGYDEALELAIAPVENFTKFVQKVRKAMAGERVIISPRASIDGGKLLLAGWNIEKVINATIKAGLPEDLKLKVDIHPYI